jgi:hypothetical protein
MELESGRSELGVLAHVDESLLSGGNNLGCHLLDVLIELSKVTSENLTVNSGQNFFLGHR